MSPAQTARISSFLALALSASVLSPARAQVEAVPPPGPVKIDSVATLCSAPVRLDRIGPPPEVIVTEAILVEALRQGVPDRCRLRATALLGYFGTARAVVALEALALSGQPGEAGVDGPTAAGALQGLGTYVRFHRNTPSATRALGFLLDASEHEFWPSRRPADPKASAEQPPRDGAHMALIGLGLSGHPAARTRLYEILDEPSADPLNHGRALLALKLWAEVDVDTPLRGD